MTSDNGIHVEKPPFFDGNNYDYCKTRMSAHLKTMSRKLWRVVSDVYSNEHGTIYAISSDFGDRMTTQSMGLMFLLSEHF